MFISFMGKTLLVVNWYDTQDHMVLKHQRLVRVALRLSYQVTGILTDDV